MVKAQKVLTNLQPPVIIKPVEKQEPKKPETIHVDNTSEAAGTDEQKLKEDTKSGGAPKPPKSLLFISMLRLFRIKRTPKF